MKITILTTDSPDLLDCETLMVGFFSDERPPKGFCGLVDWRLNGLLSREMADGRVSGALLEKLAIAFSGRLPVSRLILMGLGPLASLSYDDLYNAGYEMASTAGGLGASNIALPIPAAGRGALKLSGMTEALVTGFYDGWAGEPDRRDALRLDIPARQEHREEIHRGVDRFIQQTGGGPVLNLPEEEPLADAEGTPAGNLAGEMTP